MNRQDNKASWMGGSKLAVGTIGAIAGGVIAQFAQGGAAQAWAGVSGVANGIQTQMDGMFQHAIDVKRKELIAKAALTGAADVRKADLPDRKVERAMEMALACSMNSVTADSEILGLLTSRSTAPAGPEVTESFDGSNLELKFPYARTETTSQIQQQAIERAKGFCERNTMKFVGLKKDTKPSYACTGDNCRLIATYTCK